MGYASREILSIADMGVSFKTKAVISVEILII